jgi:hypothetical protein
VVSREKFVLSFVKLVETLKLDLCGSLEKRWELEETLGLCGSLNNEDVDKPRWLH